MRNMKVVFVLLLFLKPILSSSTENLLENETVLSTHLCIVSGNFKGSKFHFEEFVDVTLPNGSGTLDKLYQVNNEQALNAKVEFWVSGGSAKLVMLSLIENNSGQKVTFFADTHDNQISSGAIALKNEKLEIGASLACVP